MNSREKKYVSVCVCEVKHGNDKDVAFIPFEQEIKKKNLCFDFCWSNNKYYFSAPWDLLWCFNIDMILILYAQVMKYTHSVWETKRTKKNGNHVFKILLLLMEFEWTRKKTNK